MKKLLNTLYVTTENAYASLDGENIVVSVEKEELGRFPLHILEGIYLFSYSGASPALMGKCVRENINLVFLTPRGRFLARACGESNGNVLLRKEQYRISDDPFRSAILARGFLFGKLYNSRQVLARARRDHGERIDETAFLRAEECLQEALAKLLDETTLEGLRGLEGAAANHYFSRLDGMILRNKGEFYYHERSRRPPLDNVNALLSFVYTLLSNDCASAAESAGLDSYVGFLHRDKPGRTSLALDLVEELRPCLADRFVLTLINDRVVTTEDFQKQENGSVLLTDVGRKKLQKEWQSRKQTKIMHPYLQEKIEWGLIPYVQALLLARCIRGDLDGYPPFLWK